MGNNDIIKDDESIESSIDEELEDSEELEYGQFGKISYPLNQPIDKNTQRKIIAEMRRLNEEAEKYAKDRWTWYNEYVKPNYVDVTEYFSGSQILELQATALESLSNGEKARQGKEAFYDNMRVFQGQTVSNEEERKSAFVQAASSYKVLRLEYNKLGFFRFFKAPSMFFALRSMKSDLLKSGEVNAEQLKEFEHDRKINIYSDIKKEEPSEPVAEAETEFIREPVPDIEKDVMQEIAPQQEVESNQPVNETQLEKNNEK